MGMTTEEPYLSDDSSFYGDHDITSTLESRAESMDVEGFWKEKKPSLMEIAEANRIKRSGIHAMSLYNPYEGSVFGRQLDESVDDFLKRLPPATNQVSDTIPWIRIANPYTTRESLSPDASANNAGEEAPQEESSRWASFVTTGNIVLRHLAQARKNYEVEFASQPAMRRTRALNSERDQAVKKIQELAAEKHCVAGKWMLFVSVDEVNAIWASVARATANNELGTGAKVAPRGSQDLLDRGARLICIYTEDFTDKKDITLVLHKIRDLGLIDTKARPIYYKCDAYTYLRLGSGNEYDIKPSLYSSAEILGLKKQKRDEVKSHK
ncbi:MAG: hypothetical protein M1818_000678 [Claussenomyces sp. TS43310]|nr:MAG: hypothetical protein M1818_000678 [Claussenomyces sp. TS43310]